MSTAIPAPRSTTPFELRLDVDIPLLGLRRGDTVRVDPDAPVAPGDLVLVQINHDLRQLARFREDFHDAVVGRAEKL